VNGGKRAILEVTESHTHSSQSALKIIAGSGTSKSRIKWPIADRLYLSRHTVKSHAMAIYRKLNVTSRNDAVERAHALGLL